MSEILLLNSNQPLFTFKSIEMHQHLHKQSFLKKVIVLYKELQYYNLEGVTNPCEGLNQNSKALDKWGKQFKICRQLVMDSGFNVSQL